MRKIFGILSIILILFITHCAYEIFSYDNRSAATLSAYCNIDFRSVTEPTTNTVSGATLSIVDFRYASGQLEKQLLLDIDGKKFKLNEVEISSKAPAYTDGNFKHANTLFAVFPPQILKEIATADKVKVSFKYTDKTSGVELPLSAPDLVYWKKQLPPL